MITFLRLMNEHMMIISLFEIESSEIFEGIAMKYFFPILIFALLQQAPPAQTPQFKGLDLYGSSQITLEQVQQKFGDKITKYVESYARRDFDTAESLNKEIITGIRQMGQFAYIGLSLIIYYTEPQSIYLTIDLVDEKDRAERMTFLPDPAKEFTDPDSLFKLWEEYEKTGFDLLSKGEMKSTMPDCPVLHCIFGFEHPSLKKYLEVFNNGAAKHKQLLIEIMREDKDAAHRAYAAFVLAHSSDVDAVVNAMLPAIPDQHSAVRNNAMRVLAFIAERRKDVDVPLDPILKAINYPTTTDRNKALYILSGLADNPKNKKAITQKAGLLLLKLLKLSQLNNHDPAYSVLKKISGKDFGDRDYKAWEEWLNAELKN